MKKVTRWATIVALVPGMSGAWAQFHDERRLDPPVSHVSRARPLFETIEAVSEKTGVKLSVAEDIREDLIVVRVVDVPASEILKRIAEHFSWTWRKTEDGWELHRSSEQKRAEEEAVRAQILAPFLKQQEQLERLIEETSSWTPEEAREKLRQHLVTNVYDSIGLREAAAAHFKINLAIDPSWMLLARAYVTLTEGQLWEIYHRGKVVLSTSPVGFQYKLNLSEDFLRKTLAGQEEKQLGFIESLAIRGYPELSEKARRLFYRNSDIRAIRVEFRAGNRDVDTLMQIGAASTVLLHNGEARYWSGTSSFVSSENSFHRQITPPRLSATSLDSVKYTNDDIARIFGDSREKIIEKIAVPVTEFLKPRSKTHPLESAGTLLVNIAIAADRNIISDSYEPDLLHLLSLGQNWESIAQSIDTIAELTDRAWEDSDGWIEMRVRAWQLRRHAETPSSTLFAIRDLTYETIGNTLDGLGWIASRLNQEQAMGLIIASLKLARFDSRNYFAARLWGELGPINRAQLRSGAPLPYSALTPTCKDLYLTCLLRAENVLYLDRTGDPTEKQFFDASRQSTGYIEDEWLSTVTDSEVTQLLPHGIPMDAALDLSVQRSPAMFEMREFGTFEIFDLTTGGSIASRLEAHQSERDARYRVAAREVAFLRMAIRPELARGHFLDAKWADPNAPLVDYVDLPVELVHRMKKAHEAVAKSRSGSE